MGTRGRAAVDPGHAHRSVDLPQEGHEIWTQVDALDGSLGDVSFDAAGEASYFAFAYPSTNLTLCWGTRLSRRCRAVTKTALTGAAKSYSERLFRFPAIDRLPDFAAREALELPARAAGVSFQPQATDKILALDESFFQVRIGRASQIELAYLSAMADLGQGPYRPFRLTDSATASHPHEACAATASDQIQLRLQLGQPNPESSDSF